MWSYAQNLNLRGLRFQAFLDSLALLFHNDILVVLFLISWFIEIKKGYENIHNMEYILLYKILFINLIYIMIDFYKIKQKIKQPFNTKNLCKYYQIDC